MATYGSQAGIEALVPALGYIEQSTVPDVGGITAWLAEGYSIINRELTSAGFSTPATSGMAVYGELTALNNLYAAAYAVRARGLGLNAGVDEGESRDNTWLREFWMRLDRLKSSDLTQMGMAVLSSKKRRRVRTMQIRRVDGFSGAYEGSTADPEYTSE